MQVVVMKRKDFRESETEHWLCPKLAPCSTVADSL